MSKVERAFRLIIVFGLVLTTAFSMPFELSAANATEQGLKSVSPSSTFHDTLDKAYLYGVRGQFNKSIPLFEQLLKSHPEEWIVYDFYDQILELKGDFPGAEQILKQALEKNLSNQKEQIEARLNTLEEKKEFAQAMKAAPSWTGAQVFGNQEFVIKTNIPEIYHRPLIEHLGDLLRKEKKLMTDILGPEKKPASYVKVLIVGRYSEYLTLMDEWKKKFEDVGGGRPLGGHGSKGFIDNHENEIVIYFDGSWDWYAMAYGMAHCLLGNFYASSPSRFASEGLAQYISYKLEKKDAKSEILSKLEFINFLYGQGELEHAMAVFSHWPGYGMTRSDEQMFALMSWSLTYFFIERGHPVFKDFFEQYLKYERENASNDMNTSHDCFTQHLSQAQMNELDKEWIKFILGITYEKI
ncbi:MAG: tetratricopeptide repeat protein [Candidatus Omnitrophota bacterium]